MYDFDDSERREVEEEFGLEFTSATDVDDPGEAGIDVPDADEVADNTNSDPVDVETAEPGFATDGGTVAQTPDATTTASSPTSPDPSSMRRSGRTAVQMMDLEEDESGVFSELMHFCMKEHAGERPRRRLLAAIASMDGPGYDDLSEVLGRSERQIKNYVSELRDAGVIVTQGRGSPSTHVVFANRDMEVLAKRALALTGDMEFLDE